MKNLEITRHTYKKIYPRLLAYAISMTKDRDLAEDLVQDTLLTLVEKLKPDAKKDVLFNPNESIDFNGHTGPFIQYTYARICSIVEKKDKFDIKLKIQRDLEPEEKKIIKSIMHYPNVIKYSSETFNPSVLANYLFNLAKSYNHFYQKIPILNCGNFDDINFRVTLSKKVSVLIKRGMNILGIDLPSKM